MRRTRAENQLVDPVGDALGSAAQLRHGPVGGVALGDVLRRGMVDQPLGQASRQHELAVGDGDEAVAERMEPEFCPARLADARIEMLDGFEVAGCAGLGRKHPRPRRPVELLAFGEPALQDRGELAGDRELQRLAALGVVDARAARTGCIRWTSDRRPFTAKPLLSAERTRMAETTVGLAGAAESGPPGGDRTGRAVG